MVFWRKKDNNKEKGGAKPRLVVPAGPTGAATGAPTGVATGAPTGAATGSVAKPSQEPPLLAKRVVQLEAENRSLRQALEFYADSSTWEAGHKFRDLDEATIFADDSVTPAGVDSGTKARQALKPTGK